VCVCVCVCVCACVCVCMCVCVCHEQGGWAPLPMKSLAQALLPVRMRSLLLDYEVCDVSVTVDNFLVGLQGLHCIKWEVNCIKCVALYEMISDSRLHIYGLKPVSRMHIHFKQKVHKFGFMKTALDNTTYPAWIKIQFESSLNPNPAWIQLESKMS